MTHKKGLLSVMKIVGPDDEIMIVSEDGVIVRTPVKGHLRARPFHPGREGDERRRQGQGVRGGHRLHRQEEGQEGGTRRREPDGPAREEARKALSPSTTSTTIWATREKIRKSSKTLENVL